MKTLGTLLRRGALLAACIACLGAGAFAQTARQLEREEAEFGPIVRAYLGYLRAQQEVVDDRRSRHEVNPRYYLHNSNRIKALRRMAMSIARETENDYLPELEAVSLAEFDTLFDEPPKPASLHVGGVLNHTFRYLGMVAVGRDKFYLFARLDPYEQVELRKKAETQAPASEAHTSIHPPAPADPAARPRRVNSP